MFTINGKPLGILAMCIKYSLKLFNICRINNKYGIIDTCRQIDKALLTRNHEL
jgi:hypothetical protein